jgi:hypothetical protein
MSLAESAIEFYTRRVRIFYIGELAMSKIVSLHFCRAILIGVVTLVASVAPSFSQDNKILGGYFEEWSIY